MPSQIFQAGLLDGQVALVSGGGSGLGRATALELAALGGQVVVCGRRLEPLMGDLPVAPVRERRGGRRRDLAPFLVVSLMLVAIWALTGMGYFWPVWPIAGWGVSFVAPGSLGRPCRRRSSNPGSSTGRWPSSAAVGPGSGGQLR